jgi:hypothetical protein
MGGGWCGTPITDTEMDAVTLEDTLESCHWRSQGPFGQAASIPVLG